MKGYIALNTNMLSHSNMTYEIGKKYTITGKLKMYENGYHFCKCLENIEKYCTIVDFRVFKIKTEGKVINKWRKSCVSCAESITLVQELSKEEIYQYFADNQKRILRKAWYCRKALADQGLCLDKLVYDKDPDVRKAVAEQGYDLHILIHDKDPRVRAAVAKQGYNLDTLVHDEDDWVRAVVASQKYDLDILINDESLLVRAEVAKQGYGLGILMHDETSYVRRAVIEQKYGLDTFVKDNSPFIRELVAEQKYGLDREIQFHMKLFQKKISHLGLK